MTPRIWGRRPVLEALRAHPDQVIKIYLAHGSKGDVPKEVGRLAKQHHVVLVEEERAVLVRLVGHERHQGVVAELSAPLTSAGDPLQLVQEARERGEQPFLLLLDQIQDPQNLGAILRTASAAGVHGVVVLKDRAASVTPAVLQASAGAAAHIPVCSVTNLVNIMEALKKEGVWVVGSDIEAKESYTQFDWKRPLALVMGQEGEGMRRLVKERCDALVKIPLSGPIASLNVSVAAGVLLFEILRNRSIR